jgi:nicotinamide riboside transporter PnuC
MHNELLYRGISCQRPFVGDHELELFTHKIDPSGIFLWISTDNGHAEQLAIIKRLNRLL